MATLMVIVMSLSFTTPVPYSRVDSARSGAFPKQNYYTSLLSALHSLTLVNGSIPSTKCGRRKYFLAVQFSCMPTCANHRVTFATLHGSVAGIRHRQNQIQLQEPLVSSVAASFRPSALRLRVVGTNKPVGRGWNRSGVVEVQTLR